MKMVCVNLVYAALTP
nr:MULTISPECIES: hypothetical protein [Vibrio]